MIMEALTDEDIERTYPVMRQLRPHIAREDYLSTVKRMQEGGYRLVFAESDGAVRAVAGFRFVEMLHRGRSVYVDDLVTAEKDRSRGYGEQLMAWLLDFAADQECPQLHLDSGVHRARAHRFYFRQGMEITSFHFAIPVPGVGEEQ